MSYITHLILIVISEEQNISVLLVLWITIKIKNILITFLEVFRLNSCLVLGSSTSYISIFYYSVDNSMWGNKCLARGRSIMGLSWTLSTDTWAHRAFGWPDSLFITQLHSLLRAQQWAWRDGKEPSVHHIAFIQQVFSHLYQIILNLKTYTTPNMHFSVRHENMTSDGRPRLWCCHSEQLLHPLHPFQSASFL